VEATPDGDGGCLVWGRSAGWEWCVVRHRRARISMRAVARWWRRRGDTSSAP